MRLLDRVFTEEVLTDFTPKESDDIEWLLPNRAKPPLGVIVGDEVATLLPHLDLLAALRFEGVHPPYPTTWIEGREPDGDGTLGAMLRQFRGTFRGEYHEGFQATIFFTRRHCAVVLEPYVLQLETQDGRLKQVTCRAGSKAQGPSQIEMFSYAGFLVLTLGMANARNVRVEPVEPAAKLSRKFEKRSGRPLVKFGRIILPAKTRAAVNLVQARKTAGEVMPLHLRRGHNKTYTEERPLFGQHVGTYFWDWAVVGDPGAGINVNTYEVRPPDGPPASGAG
jgi:hypothetical protein